MDLPYLSPESLQKLFLLYRNNLEILEEQIATLGGPQQAGLGLINLRNQAREVLQAIEQKLALHGVTPLSEEEVYHDLLIELFDNERGMLRYQDKIRLDRARARLRITDDRAAALEGEVRENFARETFASIKEGPLDEIITVAFGRGYTNSMIPSLLLLGKAIRLSPDLIGRVFLSHIAPGAAIHSLHMGQKLMKANNVNNYSDDRHLFERFVQVLVTWPSQAPIKESS